jgi:DNA-binding transcriptional MerR regulator
VPERAYLSIGEVLALLKDEFSDITISKIRFLESQGLIDPERTPSGYRKFYEPDVERLRWILRQQKEHYLPLRVIKGKLAEAPSGEEGVELPDVDGISDEDQLDGDDALDEVEPEAPPVLTAVPDPPDESPDANGAQPPILQAVGPERLHRSGARDRHDGEPPERGRRRAAPPFPESLRRSARSSPAAHLTAPEPPPPTPPPEPAAPRAEVPPAAATADTDLGDEEIELTADELAAASGLPVLAVAELERYGLVKGQPGPGGRYYDDAALEVALLAAEFARFGVEARHLKMWKTAADREADFYEQVVTPLRSQRSTKARRQAGDTVTELADLGARLHAALLAGAMKRLT